jgi:hypothetical protein
MAEKSIFQAFIIALKKRWKVEHPSLRPLIEARGMLPKTSTFYAGVVRPTGLHVYLYFQPSSKSWEVGRFTINVVLAADKYNPQIVPAAKTGPSLGEGYQRIGLLVGKKDKWYHLKSYSGPGSSDAWVPSSYADEGVVIAEAVEAVTRDVLTALSVLDVAGDSS